MLIPLLIGAGIYLYFPSGPNWLTYLLLTLLLFCFLFVSFKKAWAIVFLLLMTGLGYGHFMHHDNAYQCPDVQNADSIAYRSIKVKEAKFDKENKRWKGIFTLRCKVEEKKLDVYAWVEASEKYAQLQQGDHLWVKTKLKRPGSVQLAGEFDFRAYLRKKNIFYTAYISSSQIINYQPKEHNAYKRLLKNWRRQQKANLYAHTDSISANLLNAILFGDSDRLSKQTRMKFTEVGIAHILAVSGMHVGILILIIQSIIGLLYSPSAKRRWISFILIVIFIWLYVALCEFASSACRAALMASLYYFGRALNVKSSGMNALSASGLILFLINPFYLLDLGTQLSFAAMIGILISFKRIEYFLTFLGISRKLSSLIAISLSAQLGVAPLILYYFGQLPLVFWIFSIPAAYFAVLLFSGGWLLVLFQQVFIPIAKIIGSLLSYLCSAFFSLLTSHHFIPLPKLELPYFPLSYLAFYYILIMVLCLLFYSRTKKASYALLKFSLIVLCFWNIHYEQQKRKVHLLPIEKKGVQNICFITRGKAKIVNSKASVGKTELESILLEGYPVDTITEYSISKGSFEKLWEANIHLAASKID